MLFELYLECVRLVQWCFMVFLIVWMFEWCVCLLNWWYSCINCVYGFPSVCMCCFQLCYMVVHVLCMLCCQVYVWLVPKSVYGVQLFVFRCRMCMVVLVCVWLCILGRVVLIVCTVCSLVLYGACYECVNGFLLARMVFAVCACVCLIVSMVFNLCFTCFACVVYNWYGFNRAYGALCFYHFQLR